MSSRTQRRVNVRLVSVGEAHTLYSNTVIGTLAVHGSAVLYSNEGRGRRHGFESRGTILLVGGPLAKKNLTPTCTYVSISHIIIG